MDSSLMNACLELGKNYDEYFESISVKFQPRWEKNLSKISFNHEQLHFLHSDYAQVNILVFARENCPDSAAAVPIIHAMAEETSFIKWRILDRDEHLDIFNRFKINNKELIPVILFLNKEYFEVARWVERSTYGYQLVYEAKKEAASIPNSNFKEIKHNKYNLNSPKLVQSNIDELFQTLKKAVYMVNTAEIQL